MTDYIGGKWCRRVILDGVMDGRTKRFGCEEGEETCDIREQGRLEDALQDEVEATEEEEEEQKGCIEATREIRERFEMQQRAARFERFRAEEDREKQAEEVDDFMEQLESWTGSCVMCRLKGREEWEHEFESCPRRDEDEERRAVQVGIKEMEKEMFSKSKKRFKNFSACFDCGLPQWICSRWKAKDDGGGRFVWVRGRECQHGRMLARLYSGVFMMYTDEAKAKLEEMIKEDGCVWGGDDDKLYTWLGGYIKWAGLETNRLCRVFYYVCKIAEEMGFGEER